MWVLVGLKPRRVFTDLEGRTIGWQALPLPSLSLFPLAGPEISPIHATVEHNPTC